MKNQQFYYKQYVNFIKAMNPVAVPEVATERGGGVKANGIGGIATGLSQDIESFSNNSVAPFMRREINII
jgi:hypothetical protein